jgi:ribosomal protein S18 acetylase RimI-like enzyme
VAETQTIRCASVADARVLAEFAARLFEETFGPENDPADMRAYLAGAFSTERQAAELSDTDRVAFIADENGGEPIGYALLRRGSRADGVVADRPAEIQRIYAVRALHGRGIGNSLMAACLKQARSWGCDVLWLAVWERNPRAIAFYEKNGFTKVGRTTFKLGNDIQFDDVMARSLL